MKKITNYKFQITNHKHIRPIFIFIISFLLSGCERVSENKIEEVLLRDPSFKKELSSKRRVDVEIAKLRDAYAEEKSLTENKIRRLREDLLQKKTALRAQIAALEQGITPFVETLTANLEKTRAEYIEKKSIFRESSAKSKNITKLLAKKGELALSADEISVWNKRKDELGKEIIALRRELDELRSRINLIKTEIAILRE